MSASIRKAAIILIGLTALAATASAQPSGDQKPRRPPSYLYQVSNKDEKSGEARIGFIDNTGKLVIPFDRLPKTTVGVGEFHEGRAVIYLREETGDKLNGNSNYRAGYIDETGKVVIAPRFDSARDFSEGLAYVELDASGFRGFIDREGKTVIKVDAPTAKDFHEGLAAVGTREGRDDRVGDWGYIDRSGREVIKRQYFFAEDFAEGLAGVLVDNGKYGFINQRGTMVIPPNFEPFKGLRHKKVIMGTSRFSAGLACVKEAGGFYGYINKKGEFAIPPRFERAQEFSEGLAWVVTKDWKAGWIDKSGQLVVTGINGQSFPARTEIIYTDEILDWRYSEGLVPFILYVENKFMRGYMDRSGRVVIKLQRDDEFGTLNPFSGGVAMVYLFVQGKRGEEQKYGYIDKTGRFLWRQQ